MGLLGAIETGGTKTVLAVGDASEVHRLEQFPTGDDPDAAMARAAAFLLAHGPVDAVGFGSFGPCDPDPRSPTYGSITTTPKPGWAGADAVGLLRRHGVQVPVAFDTDVNAAAVGEWRCGAGRGTGNVLYVTVGTGIGGGAVVDGRVIHGASHPEMGHQRLAGTPAQGVCPYHGNCWEGVASGPAMLARWGRPAQDLPVDHPAWDAEADLLATGLANLVLVLAPDVVVVGGGVGSQPHLHDRLGPRLADRLGGYVPVPVLARPALGPQSAIRGALVLAEEIVA